MNWQGVTVPDFLLPKPDYRRLPEAQMRQLCSKAYSPFRGHALVTIAEGGPERHSWPAVCPHFYNTRQLPLLCRFGRALTRRRR